MMHEEFANHEVSSFISTPPYLIFVSIQTKLLSFKIIEADALIYIALIITRIVVKKSIKFTLNCMRPSVSRFFSNLKNSGVWKKTSEITEETCLWAFVRVAVNMSWPAPPRLKEGSRVGAPSCWST